MKFCKDCKYVQRPVTDDSVCKHDSALQKSSVYFVTGDITSKSFYRACAMRAGICGGGKLFEPFNPLERAGYIMKLCKDCKHFVVSKYWNDPDLASKHATCGRTSRVNGDDGNPCLRERRWGFFSCGPKAKYWEPMTP